MGMLQELVQSYERLAADREDLANSIIAGLNTLTRERQVSQLKSADTLLQEAQLLRQEASRLHETWSLLNHRSLQEKDIPLSNSEDVSQLVLRGLNILRPTH